jgi:histone H2B
MAPKAADKKPASKAPATASKAPEKKDAGKKTAASGDKKKRSKSRKETYSSYIYKGEFQSVFNRASSRVASKRVILTLYLQSSSRSTPTLVSPTAPCLS